MRQIATKISDAAHDRLQRLAHQNKTNFATIIEQAIMAYQPLTSETIDTSNDLQSLIEAALEPVLARVAALESLGLVKPLSPEHGVVVSVEASHQGGDLSADDHAGVVEVVADRIASEIAPGAAVDAIERAAALATSTTNYPAGKALPPMDIAVLELAKQGMGQTAIAAELTARGYRADSGKPIKKGHGTITRLVKQVRGK